MIRDLATIPIESIAFRDIEQLIGTEEGPRVEFKRTLATHDGRPDRWMTDQSKVGNVARDDIAKEVVAFANAYGGLLVVGIEETEDNPKRAKSIAAEQIPQVVDCAEQLERALRSIIEPPLPMIELRGIVSNGDTGVLLVRVGSSPSAPHGFGRPSSAYVRRGSSSEPLTMRDLQSIFFERRAILERLQARRESLRLEGEQLHDDWRRSRLLTPNDRQPFTPESRAVFFRCSAVSSEDLAITNFPDRFFTIRDRSPPNPKILPHGELIALPTRIFEWRRRYRSVQYASNVANTRYWKAEIHADGSFNLISIMKVSRGAMYLHPCAAAALQVMVLTEWMRRWSARPDIEYVLDADFICHHPVGFYYLGGVSNETTEIPWETARIGPYSVGRRSGFREAFDTIERDLWDLFGERRPEGLELKVKLDEVFELIGL